MTTTAQLPSASISTRANVYFDGMCVSHSVTFADGTKKSVGVVLPSQLTFNTAAAEIMECTGGSCEYRVAGTQGWRTSEPGDRFSVPANSSFDIRVSEQYHYICHFE